MSPPSLPRGPRASPSRFRRRWILVLSGTLLLLGTLFAAGAILAPRLGPWVVERRVLPALQKRFGRHITVGRVTGGMRQMVLEDVRVSGPNDCAAGPLLHAGRVVLRYDFRPLLSGRLVLRAVSVERPRICIRRQASGQDNISDVFQILSVRRPEGRLSWKLDGVQLTQGTLDLRDEGRGVRLWAPEVEGRLVPGGESHLALGQPRVTTPGREPIEAVGLDLWFRTRAGRLVGLPRLAFSGGRLRLAEHLLLSDIQGRITPEPGRWLDLDLGGSYGGVGAPLWKAKGRVRLGSWKNPRPVAGTLTVQASRFSMDKLTQVLRSDHVPRPGEANLEVDLSLSLKERILTFEGQAGISGLTVTHPRLSTRPVEGIGATATVKGRYLVDQDLLQIPEVTLERQGVTVLASLGVYRLRHTPRIRLSLRVPSVPCARVLRALPKGLAPSLERLEVAGHFDMRLAVEADFKYLTRDSVSLAGRVNTSQCQVVSVPWELSAERLLGPFSHEVVDGGQRLGMEIGPDNPDFVPVDQVSLHLQNAILTTEDSRFFFHKGFIPREFQSALARNLIQRRFAFGASSITMQTVKNVLLDQQKTLARKLQELVLTWYLEESLSKKRIFEIYLNVIELGPGIYGVGRAAWHLFGRDASDLEPQEAAYLASILPSPRRHYRKFCHQEVPVRWRRWVDRILRIMHKRKRLSDAELQRAIESPIRFSEAERGTLGACLARARGRLPK